MVLEQPMSSSIGQPQTGGVLTNGDLPHTIKAATPHHVVYAPGPPQLEPSSDVLLRDNNMTGKKIVSLERPDDNARHLASLLTLEEKVGKRCLRIVHDLFTDWSRSRCLQLRTFGAPCHCQIEVYLQ